MSRGFTVKELAADFNDAVNKGFGDKIVLISNDDEGNGFHTVWYTLTTDITAITDTKEFCGFHDDNDPNDVVLLG